MLDGSRISDNIAHDSGGAIFTGFDADLGGIFLLEILGGSALSGNRALSGDGGAVNVVQYIYEVRCEGNSTISLNVAVAGSGGAVAAFHITSLILRDAIVADNLAGRQAGGGGAFWIQRLATIHMANSEAYNNSASLGDGGFLATLPPPFMLLDSSRLLSNSDGRDGGAISIATTFGEVSCLLWNALFEEGREAAGGSSLACPPPSLA